MDKIKRSQKRIESCMKMLDEVEVRLQKSIDKMKLAIESSRKKCPI